MIIPKILNRFKIIFPPTCAAKDFIWHDNLVYLKTLTSWISTSIFVQSLTVSFWKNLSSQKLSNTFCLYKYSEIVFAYPATKVKGQSVRVYTLNSNVYRNKLYSQKYLFWSIRSLEKHDRKFLIRSVIKNWLEQM